MYAHSFMIGDQQRMVDLLVAYRSAGYMNLCLTVWRWRQLLESRVWDKARDIQLWEDAQGRLIACALLWKRQPDDTTYTLERVLSPDLTDDSLLSKILEWAINRVSAEAAERQSVCTLAALPLEKDMDQDIDLLEFAGFSCCIDGYNAYMGRPLSEPLLSGELPPRFRLLPLTEDLLEWYQEAYGFTAVNIEHRRDLLHQPEYQHFVIKAPAGQLAAYLEFSFCRAEWADNRRHVGWIDYVQTQPDFLRNGLGQILLARGLEHLRAQGANYAQLITRHDNYAAQALFRSVGMDLVYAEHVYLKTIPGG
jgi:ribosomal protein S18 acetylase RimI-like enzyme